MIYWILAGVLSAFVFAPRYGALALLRERGRLRRRALFEDALKFLLDPEQQHRSIATDSLAAALGQSRGRTAKLMEDMQNQSLVRADGAAWRLTPDGERWALHVVRAHRLWERYLADEARMPLRQIHDEANRREHGSTEEQLDRLDAALGHPARDPHGDPIPTRDGRLARAEWTPLSRWQAEGPARIAHIEDEPALAYQQILACGLRLGQTLRVLERTPGRISFSDGEREYHLAPAVAANVCVRPISEPEMPRPQALRLSELLNDQSAEIVRLDEALQGFTRRRFLDLGLTPGTQIRPELQTFFGDPRAYRVRGTLIALRGDQAVQVWVRPIR